MIETSHENEYENDPDFFEVFPGDVIKRLQNWNVICWITKLTGTSVRWKQYKEITGHLWIITLAHKEPSPRLRQFDRERLERTIQKTYPIGVCQEVSVETCITKPLRVYLNVEYWKLITRS